MNNDNYDIHPMISFTELLVFQQIYASEFGILFKIIYEI